MSYRSSSMDEKSTTIMISKETKKRIQERGKMGDSYDDALIRILDHLEQLEEKERKRQPT